MAQGDFVIVHRRFSGFGAPVNWIAADIVRIQNGILVEHWDLIQDEATEEQSISILTTCLRRMNTAPALALIGPFYPMWDARFRRILGIVLGVRVLGDVMILHVIVLEPGLVIFKIYNSYWFFGRPTIEELRQALRVVLKKCRPDWDTTTPELKAAWERPEHDRSYPMVRPTGRCFGSESKRRWGSSCCHRIAFGARWASFRGPLQLEVL